MGKKIKCYLFKAAFYAQQRTFTFDSMRFLYQEWPYLFSCYSISQISRLNDASTVKYILLALCLVFVKGTQLFKSC